MTIGRSSNWRDLQTWHYPGSRIGNELAENLVQAAPDLALASHPPRVQEGYQYLLRHTACPAVWLAWPGPTDPAAESLAGSPAYLQAEGRAILLAVAATFAAPTDSLPTVNIEEVLAKLPPEAITHLRVRPGHLGRQLALAALAGQSGDRPGVVVGNSSGLDRIRPRRCLVQPAGILIF